MADFALSNLVNGGIYRIYVLTQYKSHSLDRHMTTAWRLNSLLGNDAAPVPAQQRLGPHWQTGSADAIYQSLNLIHGDRPDLVAVFGADHVYRMDPAQMIEAHLAWGGGVTVAAIPVPRPGGGGLRRRAGRAGRPPDRGVPGKARRTAGLPGSPDEAFASMGNYVFDPRRAGGGAAEGRRRRHAASTASAVTSSPCWCGKRVAHVYDFLQNKVPGADGRDQGYWREVGTLDSYFEAHMDLCAVHPVFNLYNDQWPILTLVRSRSRRPSSYMTTGDRVDGRSTAWSATG